MLSDGLRKLEAHKATVKTTLHEQLVNEWSAKIRADSELRYPHRKLLDVLLLEFDATEGAFQGIHFSRLVKSARVGKNMAKRYLTLLEARGYVQKRSDGYRVFYAICRTARGD